MSYDLVGVIPAAGTANRIGPLPCCKELLPVGFHRKDKKDRSQVKVVSHYLIEKMRRVNVSKVYIILRKGKWDIPAYFGDGKNLGIPLAYLMMDLPFGVPYTLDQAYPFVKDSVVVFGFPDILFKPQDAFVHLLNRQTQSDADVVLGLFRSRQSQDEDLVEMDKTGRICKIEIKPEKTNLKYTWLIAVWTNAFTQFLHDCVEGFRSSKSIGEYKNSTGNPKEVFLGDVFNAAIQADLHINYVFFEGGTYIDIGTLENWVNASSFNYDSVPTRP